MKETLYIQIQKSIHIDKPTLYVSDIGELFCQDKTIENEISHIVLKNLKDKKRIIDEVTEIVKKIEPGVKVFERELKEEMNLQLRNPKQIINFQIKYLERPEERRHVYGVIAIGNLNMTKLEVENYYKEYFQYLKENKK